MLYVNDISVKLEEKKKQYGKSLWVLILVPVTPQMGYLYSLHAIFPIVIDKVIFLTKTQCWDFPDCPVVKTLPSNAGGAGSIPGGGVKIPPVSQPQKQNIKTEAIL